jgi:hypothetical protein
MKKLLIIMTFGFLFLMSCSSNQGYNNTGQVSVNQPKVVVTPASTSIGDNLDLQALGELVKTSPRTDTLEARLNRPGSINNLDLDGDGKVDYIKVTEYNGDNNTKGFSFTVDLPNNEKQEIATVEIQKNTNNASMNIQGNQQIYGQSSNYQSSYNLGDLMIMSYLFSYHPLYYSPYYYGYYPRYYSPYYCSPYNSYHSRMMTTTRTTTIRRSSNSSYHSKSPNSSYSSNSVSKRAQSLANPTRSQKSFSTTSNSKPSTSGFGSHSSSNSNSRTSASSSGRGSFGSSSKSSGSSSSSRSSGGSRGGRR